MLELIQVSTSMVSPFFIQTSIRLGKTFSSDVSYTKYSSDLKLGEGLCICTSFHFEDSGLCLLNGLDFYFDLFWMAWHWKPAIQRPGKHFCFYINFRPAEHTHVPRACTYFPFILFEGHLFPSRGIRTWFFLSAFWNAASKKCVGCIAGVFIEMFARVVMEKDGTRADPAWLFKTIQRTREGDPALRNH